MFKYHIIQLAPSRWQIVNQLSRMSYIAYEPRKIADFQADILGISKSINFLFTTSKVQTFSNLRQGCK